ncbi:MAG: LysM peptidoglycan-binding domain-containing protein [Chloroflexota bacterium]
MRRFVIKLTVPLLAAAGLLALFGVAPQPAAAQSGNILNNPSFEQPFELHQAADGGGFVAHGWEPWWYNDAGAEFDGPEFKQANIAVDPNRVRSGEDAQQYFRPWARHQAGVYQQVPVASGSLLRFTVYGHAWSTFCKEKDDHLDCDPEDSYHGEVNPITMKIGIDPLGGTDPFSPNIVWGEEKTVYDHYDLFSVDATSQAGQVTVFVYSMPLYAAPVVNVYWDDASLVVLQEGVAQEEEQQEAPPAAAPASNDTGSPSTVGSVERQPVSEDGVQRHTVRSGETLGGIAFAYGVLTQTLRDLNDLSTDTVYVGQVLIVDPNAGAPAEEPTEEPTEEPEATPEPQAAEDVAEQPPTMGEICLLMFEDANQDGLRDSAEGLLSGGMLNITGVVSDSYMTDGASEPHCFGDLDSGDYEVTVEAPEGYALTGLSQVPVTLSGGGEVTLSFGASPDDGGGAGEQVSADSGEAGEAGEAGLAGSRRGFGLGTIITVAAIGGVILLAVGGGVFAYFMVYRRGVEGEATDEYGVAGDYGEPDDYEDPDDYGE